MTTNAQRFYDFRESTVVLLSGMRPLKASSDVALWRCYGFFTNSVFILMITAGVTSLFQRNLNRKDFFETVHYILVLLVVGSMRAVQLLHREALDDAFDFIRTSSQNCIQTEILRRGVREILREKSFLTKIGIVWITGFTLFTPLQGLATKNPEEPFFTKKLLNLPTYFVFLNETPIGVSMGLTLFATSAIVTVLTVLSIFETYMSLSVQIQTLFQIVDNSLSEIDSRSSRRDSGNLEESRVSCLKENAHQYRVIKRFAEKALPYLNRVFFVLALLASITIATAGYMFTTEKLDKGNMLKYLASFCGEGIFTLFICKSAERIKNSCEQVRIQLFRTPWHRYGIAYREIVLIFMMCLRNPLIVQAKPFGIEASMENFYALMRATFSYMSLLKNL